MKLTKYIFLYFLFSLISVSAEENTQNAVKKPSKNRAIDEGTINDQFDYIIKKSYSYKDFKNVKLTWIYRLKKAVNDSLNVNGRALSSAKKTLSIRETEITELTSSLVASKNEISSLNSEKDTIKILGLSTSKLFYNIILWAIIIGLMVFLVIYIIRFNHGNIITKDSKKKVSELEIEFDSFRQKSLEREQQLRRKIQDEINKQRKEK